MKKAKIFLVSEIEDKLTPMIETDYESEDILQVLLSRYPDLLPGDQISPENPRQWLDLRGRVKTLWLWGALLC